MKWYRGLSAIAILFYEVVYRSKHYCYGLIALFLFNTLPFVSMLVQRSTYQQFGTHPLQKLCNAGRRATLDL